MKRADGREPDDLRPVKLIPGCLKFPRGSAMIELGDTRVVCAASVVDGVPPFLKGSGRGWVTAEYAMLPGSTPTRKERERASSKADGRVREIQRLIGRSLRSTVRMETLGERTIIVDCDVLQADGGTRTASVTGGHVALREALDWMRAREMLVGDPISSSVSAVSVGILHGTFLLDLTYEEDQSASVDMNVVMDENGRLVDIQATAEGGAFSQNDLLELLALARKGCAELAAAQRGL